MAARLDGESEVVIVSLFRFSVWVYSRHHRMLCVKIYKLLKYWVIIDKSYVHRGYFIIFVCGNLSTMYFPGVMSNTKFQQTFNKHHLICIESPSLAPLLPSFCCAQCIVMQSVCNAVMHLTCIKSSQHQCLIYLDGSMALYHRLKWWLK